MKIKSLTYEDKFYQWSLSRIDLNDLTLLVGASGVGKTQILRAIYNITQIAQGASQNGIKWHIEFEDTHQNFYQWSGEFENLGYEDTPFQNRSDARPKIIYENIIQNDIGIVRRNAADIYFNENKTVKLSQSQSVLTLIKDEPLIYIEKALRLIVFNDYTNIHGKRTAALRSLEVDPEEYANLQSIRNSDANIGTKLYLCSQVAAEVFDDIKNRFIEIFPFVENIRIRLIQIPATSIRGVQLQLKEKGLDKWIHEWHISSGMLRTLLQISELHLCADGTVFLIDEFENGLGINCIDDLTSSLMNYERDLQFIITSHHPYIINNINYKSWKIVTRKGGVVTAKDATDYNFGKSKHQAFTQLINLDAYSEGITE